MSKTRIAIGAIISAVVLGVIIVGLMVYIAGIQRNTNAAVAGQRAQFVASQTAFAQGIR